MKHILMIDDVATNLKCASEVLQEKYRISTAKSGKQALFMLRELLPDLILLDVNMPEMNGYEVLEQIKADAEIGEIPIIFLTAETDCTSEAKGLRMGAMDYIRKPFEPDIMVSRIEKVLNMDEQKRELRKIAQKDSLTELYNRRFLEEFLQKEHHGYFLLLDMDNFKKVNDNYGHLAGDTVLVKFAEVIKEEAGEKSQVCRIGGDEFAVFMEGSFEIEVIKDIVRRMIAGVEFEVNELLSNDLEVQVSVSAGIAQNPEDGDNFKELYNKADKALYFVKQNGKRGYHFYHEENNSQKEFLEESKLIDLLQLERLIREKGDQSGAYRVEYDSFKRIYNFVSRCLERKVQDVQLIMFTLLERCLSAADSGALENAYQMMEKAITLSLRKGDVATRCGNNQYVAILMDATYENGGKIAERILDKFHRMSYDGAYFLSYEMQSVGKGNTIKI